MTAEVRLGLRIGAPVWLGTHRPGMVGWDSSPRDGRVTHRGPDLVGIHHPGMGGLPIGAQIWLGFITQGWAGYPSGPRFGWAHHPGL
eukprot:4135614-Prymnesium_polylepis.1